MPTEIKSPLSCSTDDLHSFEQMVRHGAEVTSNGLSKRIKAADALGFHSVRGHLVGVGALKNPGTARKQRVFSESRTTLDPNDFPLEIGWLHVSPNYRGKGLSRKLVESMLPLAGHRGVFATARLENEPIQRTLRRCGFVQVGSAYPSERGKYQLVLFVRNG